MCSEVLYGAAAKSIFDLLPRSLSSLFSLFTAEVLCGPYSRPIRSVFLSHSSQLQIGFVKPSRLSTYSFLNFYAAHFTATFVHHIVKF